jgi:hypothetical protein
MPEETHWHTTQSGDNWSGGQVEIDWSELPTGTFDHDVLTGLLHQAGIWTYDDLRMHAQVAVGCIQQIYQVELGRLLTFAQRQQEAFNG